MSYETQMAILAYPIRHEFNKITTPEIFSLMSSVSSEEIENVISKYEGVKLSVNEIQKYALNVPINVGKKFISLSKDPDTTEIIEAYMLYYEFYNLNVLLKARLNGYLGSDIFLFDYHTVVDFNSLLSETSVQKIKESYYKLIEHHKISSRHLKDLIRTISLGTVNDLLLESSIAYYSNLIKKYQKVDQLLRSLVLEKAFYDLLLSLAKLKYLGGRNVEEIIQRLTFLSNKVEILADIFIGDGKEEFIKKCIDNKVIPSTFIVTELDDIARFRDILLKERCKNIVVSLPLNPTSIIAMLMLREIDSRNYLAMVGALLEGFSLDKLRSLLVL
jgi:vacuolar-type H+-ATPase subunit C/Vma6